MAPSPDARDGQRAGLGSNPEPASAALRAFSDRPKRSILTKMILSAGLLVTLVVGALGLLQLQETLRVYDQFTTLQEQSWRSAIRREGLAMTDKLAVTLAPAVAENNYSFVEEIMQRTADDEPILYAGAFDEGGRSIAASGTAGAEVEKYKSDKEPTLLEIGGTRALLFTAPLEYAGKGRGTVRLAYSLRELEQILARLRQDKEHTTKAAVIRIVVFGLIALVLGLALSIGQGLQITRPIRHLAERARRVAGGDLSARAQVSSADEVGQLGVTFNHMTERISALLEETADKVRLENEMQVAQAVQERLVAGADPPRFGPLQLAGFYEPASYCGGDFWNYFTIGAHKLLLVIGDVTGHGIPSALLTASAKSCVDTLQTIHGDTLGSIAQLMQTLDQVLYRAAKGNVQMTCWASLLDLKRNRMTSVNAGHPPPLLCRNTGNRPQLETLAAIGTRLGEANPDGFVEHATDLRTGDVLVWFTDGIIEGEDPAGKCFGLKKLAQLLTGNPGLPPGELRDLMIQEAYAFYRGQPPEDDITLVVGSFGSARG